MFLFNDDRLPPELLTGTALQELSRGQYLCHQGEPVHAVFTVVCGRMQLTTNTMDGKQVPLYTVRAGECVAEAALFADYYCSDVVAETKACVRVFPKHTLQKTLHNNPELAVEFMALQAKRCNTLRVHLELRSLRSARERILQFLKLSTAPPFYQMTIDRPLKNIADDLGLTHESFYRTLSGLIDEALVSRTGKVLQLNPSLLMQKGRSQTGRDRSPDLN